MRFWKSLFYLLVVSSIPVFSFADESSTIQATATVIQPLGLIEDEDLGKNENLHLRLARHGNLAIQIASESQQLKSFYFNLTGDMQSSSMIQMIHPLVASVSKSSLLNDAVRSSDSVVITIVYSDQ